MKLLRKTGKLILSFLIIIVLARVFVNQTSDRGVVNAQHVRGPDSVSGNFFLTNTTDQELLFQFYATGVGLVYNVTVNVHSNSTTGVHFFFFNDSGKCIEGTKNVTISPGETWTGNFTSHCDSDGIPLMKSFYWLVDVAESASGNYRARKVHEGYQVKWSGFATYGTYISNITGWLISESSSSVTVTGFHSQELFLGVVFCVLFFRRYRKSQQ